MKKLKKILKKKLNELKPIYLIYGEDSYLLAEFEKKFIDHFVGEDVRDFNLTYVEEDKNFFNNIKSKVNTLPFMSEKRFVVARCQDHFTGKTAEDEVMIDLISNFPESSILLIRVEGKIDGRIKINSEIKKHGDVIELIPPKYKELDKWIKNEFEKKGKKIDNRSIKLLEEMFNNELQRLDSEIEKIVTYNSDRDLIKYQDVKEVISKDRLLEDNIIFSFVDALSEKKKGKAIVLLNEMVAAGEFPLKILGNIVWQLKMLLQVKTLKTKGNNPKKIARILKQHPYPVKKSFYRCDNFTEEELEILLERFLQANLEMVTGKYNDNKMALEMALLEI